MIRWARFRSGDGRAGFGALEDGLLREYEGDMLGSARPTGRTLEHGTFTLESPCLPTKIVALWNNFHALGAKLGKQAPAHPLFFVKPATTVIGPGDPIVRPMGYTGKILFEGELGIVIGRPCKNVPVNVAADYVFGYTCVNDVTAAEVLNENPDFAQWCRSKGYDTFGCLGPVIATELDCAHARVTTRVDGVERQKLSLVGHDHAAAGIGEPNLP